MMRIREEPAVLLMHLVSPRLYPSLIAQTRLWMELCYVDIIEPQLHPFWGSVHPVYTISRFYDINRQIRLNKIKYFNNIELELLNLGAQLCFDVKPILLNFKPF